MLQGLPSVGDVAMNEKLGCLGCLGVLGVALGGGIVWLGLPHTTILGWAVAISSGLVIIVRCIGEKRRR